MEKRFAFEKAEGVLDDFDAGLGSPQFSRAYRKFKFMIAAYAYCDFSEAGQPTGERELAWAWEDAQLAFLAHGEPALHGVVLQMWNCLPAGTKPGFRRAIKVAFRAAEDATPADLPRRYLPKYRKRAIRDPDQGFDLPTILPVWGPKLRDWAEEEGEDIEDWEDHLFWVEHLARTPQADPPPPTTGHLQLVPARKDT